MPTLEMPPDLSHRPEASLPQDATITERLGDAALHDEVITEAAIEEGLEKLNLEANGVNPEDPDAGRVREIEAAHSEAFQEEIARVYEEAELENKKFDEEKAKLTDEADEEDEEDEEPKPKPAEATEAADAKPADAPEVNPSDYRGQAEQALRDAGYRDKLPVGSQVRKDPLSGNLVITSANNHNVKVIEPQSGGRNRVVDYRYNEEEGILTIKAQGMNAVTAHVGEYAPNDHPDDAKHPKPGVLKLPSAVARAVGFKEAIPVTGAAGKSRRDFDLAG